MSLYPSLEDMKVHQMMKAQAELVTGNTATLNHPVENRPMNKSSSDEYTKIYPSFNDYMGLNLSSDELRLIQSETQVAIPQPSSVVPANKSTIALLSGNSLGLQRAQINHGLREVVLCKDAKQKIGLRVKAVNKGIFVVLVTAFSPAAMVGLRFGDQILQINDQIVAGYSMENVHDILKNGPVNGIKMVIRDRPFERNVTLHKDSTGHVGFSFKNGNINTIVKNSSAAKNGLLIDHCLLEVNGQNVVGLDDNTVRKIIDSGGNIITLTIMPKSIYDHMIKSMATSLVKKLMDHSIPEI